MKKMWSMTIIFVSVLIGFIGCNVQSSAEGVIQSPIGGNENLTPIDQKFVGNWVDSANVDWIFNSDGSGSRGSTAIKFAAFSKKLIMIYESDRYRFGYGYDYIFTSNGKTLMLLGLDSGANSFLLTKKE